MFDGKYLDWNQKRIKGIIDHYGHHFMFQKRVLDLGCGHADISGALHRLGADITAVDARQEHLKIVGKKFPGIKTIKADLDRGWPFVGKQFDLILDLDLICHLNDFESHLRSVCQSGNNLILETTVCDSEDPFYSVKANENKNVYDLAMNGNGCRPTAAAIERVLKECGFTFKRLDNPKFNSGTYVYNWQPMNDGSCNTTHRRIWFAEKNKNLHVVPFTPPTEIITYPFNMTHPGFTPILQNSLIPLKPPIDPGITKTSKSLEPGKKLKTALCISGHLRTFESNYKSVKDNILDKMDCDVFIHTWDTLGLSYRFTDSNLYTAETKKMVDTIYQLYTPKKLVIEKSKPFHVTPIMHKQLLDHRDIPGILSMYYKIEECNKIKKEYEDEHNFKYDCVVRFRGDLWVEQPIPVYDNINLNHVFLPIYGNFSGACDQFAYGSSEVMDKYASLYSNIEKYLHAGAPMHPERILLFHLETLNLPIAKVSFKYVIRRANGLVQDNMLMERAWGFVR